MFRRTNGFTLVELMVVVAILGVVLGIGFMNLRTLSGDLKNTANHVAGAFKQARAKAMATTSAYRVVKKSARRLELEYANACGSDAWTTDARLVLEFDPRVKVQMQGEDAELLCFTSRGVADQNPSLTLKDERGKTMIVEVLLGGAVEIR